MFDPRISLANNRDHVRDRCESSNKPLNFASNSGKMSRDYQIRDNLHSEPLQFRTQHTEDDESGASSPPLWKTSPPRNQFHSRNHSQQQHQHHDFRSLSPSSRTQAIVKGQREMMEMVKNMPESCYELSMKDLVEYPREDDTQEQCLIQDKDHDDDQQQQQEEYVQQQQQQRVKVKRQMSNNKAKIVRCESIDNRGLFLKMVFPIKFRSKKKKNNNNNNSTTNVSTISSKVSPKPESLEKSSKGVDKDWWKRRFSNANESDGVTTSSNSASSGSSGSSGSTSSNKSSKNSTRKARQMMNTDSSVQCRKRHGLLTNCCLCFQSRKDKSAD